MTQFAFFGISFLCFIVSAGFIQGAAAQTPPKPRPFDLVSGILVACAPAPGFAWTEEACGHLVLEVRKRAAIAKVAVALVESTPDIARKKFGTVESFDGDKAIRMNWQCVESKDVKGRIAISLSSNWIWQPTAKEIPNIVPGQRIPRSFYAQQVLFDPGAKMRDAPPFLKQILDSFFALGVGKL